MFRFKGADNNVIAADVVGNSANQPVLLLHGGGQTRHAWRDSATMLADDGYFSIAVDMRGHGDSDWIPSADYSLESAAADIVELINCLDRPPFLVGASYGGLVSLVLASIHPALVKALVLVDVVPKFNLDGAREIQTFMIARPDGFVSLEDAADAIAEYLPHRGRTGSLEGLKKNLRLHKNGRYYWHWDPQFMKPDDSEFQFDILEEYSRKVQTPALLVHGSKSNLVDEEGIRHFQELMPQAQYIKVEGAGHMVVGDKNNAFHDAVVEFLNKSS